MHLPHPSQKVVAHAMMRLGAYAMIFDGMIKLGAALFEASPIGHTLHGLHEIAGIFGSNGAATAGLGAVLDFTAAEAAAAVGSAVKAVETVVEAVEVPFNGLGG